MNTDTYKLTCNACGATLELPSGPPEQTLRSSCHRCGTAVVIEWRPVPEIYEPGTARQLEAAADLAYAEGKAAA